MFGLDDWIAGFSDGAPLWVIVLVAVLLGLRHATDPDHIAAVTALVAGARQRAARQAAELGLAWGVGHAVTLFAFGLPILLLDRYLPERVQQAAETAIAAVIVYLAVRLFLRWRRGAFHVHEHEHGGASHTHTHTHAHDHLTAHAHPGANRSRRGAFGIGLVHGMGGSAGVGVLLVASIESDPVSVLALVLLAIFTAVSMTMLTTGFGLTFVSRPVQAAWSGVAPALAVASLAFGIWYGTAAWGMAPYPF